MAKANTFMISSLINQVDTNVNDQSLTNGSSLATTCKNMFYIDEQRLTDSSYFNSILMNSFAAVAAAAVCSQTHNGACNCINCKSLQISKLFSVKNKSI